MPDVVLFSRMPRPAGNHSVEIIVSSLTRYLSGRIDIAGVRASTFSSRLIPRLKIAMEARRRRGRVTHITGDINFAVIALGSKVSICTILDCHFLDSASGLRKQILKLFWLSLPVRFASRVVTISEAAKRDIIHHLGYDPHKIEVIHCPLPDDCLPFVKPFNSDCPTILQLGTATNKNVSRLIHSLAGIRCRLVVIGPMAEDLRNLAKVNKVDLIQHDAVDRGKILESYRQCDIVSFCSLYEGFGMPIIEANAIGRIVVTSNQSSMPEIAGTAAIYVDPNDVASIQKGIQIAIQDPALREKTIEDGFANAERFRISNIAERYLQLYRSML
jgi:glycosyltransferase involved in cell wall biosynthesis